MESGWELPQQVCSISWKDCFLYLWAWQSFCGCTWDWVWNKCYFILISTESHCNSCIGWHTDWVPWAGTRRVTVGSCARFTIISSDFCTVKSCSHRQTKAVTVAGAIGEQVASDRSKRATTILAVLFVISLEIQICYVWIFEGLLSNWVGLFPKGLGLFSGERVLENTPIPLLWAAT